MWCPKSIFRFIRPVHAHLKTDNVDYLKKPPWKNFFFDIFAIHLSSRYEKRCQMCVRIFCLFHGSKNQGWLVFFAHPSETDLGIVIVGKLSLLLRIFLQNPAPLIESRISVYSLQLVLHWPGQIPKCHVNIFCSFFHIMSIHNWFQRSLRPFL